jgi:putative spermidine/putrescine transport system substrate-binding protein
VSWLTCRRMRLRRLRHSGARLTVGATAVIALLLGVASAGAGAQPATLERGSQGVTLTVLDAGGVLSFTRPIIEAFQRSHPNLVDELKFEQAPSTDAVGRIRVQQAAGQALTDLVVGGGDVVGGGIRENVWQRILPVQERRLANTGRYTAQAKQLQTLTNGFAITVATEYQGPVLSFDPARVQLPARLTAQQLLAWARAHPKRFTYARPPSSGPGRHFLMALPYILGDKNPRDPSGWRRTWRYLEQLHEYVAPYPSSTSESLRGLAQQNYDLVISTVGWDLGMRAQGVHPLSYRVASFGVGRKNARWMVAGHYAMVPRGITGRRLDAVLRLLNFMLRPNQQVKMYAAQMKSQPGPAVKDVSVANASRETRAAIAKTDRPLYDALFGRVRTAAELEAATLAVALDRWEREIGR